MITIFTATYNRGYLIERLYQSLKRQTCKKFEWIVIDDGSTDNTEELFQKWENGTEDFLIRYKKVKHGGKHRAINQGVNMALTDAFFFVDSDDYLVDEAVEYVQIWFEAICEKPEFVGISGLKGYSRDKPVGGRGDFSGEFVDATNLERPQYGLNKDKAEIYKTSILKKYPFPEFENEDFLTEGVIFNRIAKDGYKIRWYKKVIYICEYLEDGLTKCGFKRSINNPMGYMSYLNLLSEIYGEHYGEVHKFGFYFVMRSINNMEECGKKMQISLSLQTKFEEKYREMIRNINQYFIEHKIRKIAIYGMGNVGNAFLSISDQLNVQIKYGIDKCQIKDKKIPVYVPEQQLPQIDAVVITLKDYNDEVEKTLKGLFDVVVYWKDISLDNWVNERR